MVRKFPSIFIILLLLSSLLSSVTLIPQPVSGIASKPTVNIAFREQNKTAKVGPGDTGYVTLTGMVSVSLNQASSVVVSLTAEDTWGSAIISPSSIRFSANGDKPFGVSVRARPAESVSNTGTITVTGRWSMHPGGLSGSANSTSGAVARIDIERYFKYNINSDNSFLEGSPGSQLEFTVTVENRGNSMDNTFDLKVKNEDELVKKGFVIKLDPVKDCNNVTIKVTIPEDIEADCYYDIILEVFPEGPVQENNLTQNNTYKLKVYVNEEPLPLYSYLSLGIIIILFTPSVLWLLKRRKNRKKLKTASKN